MRRIQRMDELMAAKGFRHFEEKPAYRFLVARDEWDRTFAPILSDMKGQRLEYGGWPVEPDDSLSSGSIVFVKRIDN